MKKIKDQEIIKARILGEAKLGDSFQGTFVSLGGASMFSVLKRPYNT